MLRLRQQLLVIDLGAAVGFSGGELGVLEVRCRKLT